MKMKYEEHVPEYVQWLSEGCPPKFMWTPLLLAHPLVERAYDRAWPLLSWRRDHAHCSQFCSHDEEDVDCWLRWSGGIHLKILYWNLTWQPYTVGGLGLLPIARYSQLRAAEGFCIL